MVSEFVNESILDFSDEEHRRLQEEAIARVQSQLGQEWGMVIHGKRVKSPDQFLSNNPSNPDEVIGIYQKCVPEQAEQAIRSAWRAFDYWKTTAAEVRAEYCFKIAKLMRDKYRYELNAWMILEVGKTWIEADADTAEAVDLIDWYGREALRYAQDHPLPKIPSEKNELRYIPLGVGIIIPPWNFPVAILGGMTMGAVAAGNTVVLKPSSDAPGIAKKFMEVVEEAGLPHGVINLVTGPGSEVGDHLVRHPKTRFISFTGSKEVGLRINELAARTEPGQMWIKRVVAEMGGKDPIIVDSEADMEDAVHGVMVSAFGYSGQKCSACSRAIVVADVYDDFIDALVEKTQQLKVGPGKDPETQVGPVINLSAVARIQKYIEIGKREGELVCGGGRKDGDGLFIEPTIIKDINRKATLAQEEVFGPVLAVLKAQDYDDAIDIANDSEYGLTGSVYTQNREKIEKAKEEFFVGNLYFNRKSTGALVGVHPFGGFNMSGTDSKAGGGDYLMLFTQAKAMSEKIA
jgi:1-pyrroline-5-carboxylate dehydrogenase